MFHISPLSDIEIKICVKVVFFSVQKPEVQWHKTVFFVFIFTNRTKKAKDSS